MSSVAVLDLGCEQALSMPRLSCEKQQALPGSAQAVALGQGRLLGMPSLVAL